MERESWSYMLRLVMSWHVRHMCVVVCHGKAIVIKHAPPIVGTEFQLHISFLAGVLYWDLSHTYLAITNRRRFLTQS